jgi:lipoprotein-anchoring transpeptidase ErfK/SrfK
MTRASTGKKYFGHYKTPLGSYITNFKRATRHMASGDLASDGYDLPGVPWVSYFTEKGVSFHGTYWHNDFGTPHSHGCINLTSQSAKWIYLWTLPAAPADKSYVYKDYGTSVEVVVA